MKALLIMPQFFEYPEAICKELKDIGYEVDFFDDRPSTKGLVKAIIRVKKDLIGIYIKRYFEKMMQYVREQDYDVVIVISGQSFSFNEDMMLELKECQRRAFFVLYQWDSEENFPYIKRMQKYFDRCYSFDREDVKRNKNLKFLPLFYTRKYEEIAKRKNKQFDYDFSFIGTAHPKKYKFINQISRQLKDRYPNQFIYFYFPSKIVYYYRKLKNPELRKAKRKEFHFVSIKGEELNRIIENSRCILDSPQDGQTGLTIRVLEALGSKKKLITTNKDIRNYDFYREENIYVYDGAIDLNSVFFIKEYKEVEYEIYKKYSLENWLKTILTMG